MKILVLDKDVTERTIIQQVVQHNGHEILTAENSETAAIVSAPVAIGITRNGQRLFHAALPGSSADNDAWIERKTRVVDRFGHSSLYMGQLARDAGSTVEEMFGLDPRLFAAHGGAFPILVRSVGPVGVVVVSGLPQVEDHRMVVAALRAHLARG